MIQGFWYSGPEERSFQLMGYLPWWVWLIFLISWPFVGYFNSRLINAFNWQHNHGRSFSFGSILEILWRRSSCRCLDSTYYWGRPVETEAGKIWFTVGVLAGWTGLIVTVLVVVLIIIFAGLSKIGGVLSPQ